MFELDIGPRAGIRGVRVSLELSRPLFMRVKRPGLGRGFSPACGRRGAEIVKSGGNKLSDRR